MKLVDALRDDFYIIYEFQRFVNTFFKSFFQKFFGEKAGKTCSENTFLENESGDETSDFTFPKHLQIFSKKDKLFFKKVLTFPKKCV